MARAWIGLVLPAVLGAQVPNYNGVWSFTWPTWPVPNTYDVAIVAQPPAITLTFPPGVLFVYFGPLPGSLSSPTTAIASGVTPASQCMWRHVVNLTFVGPDQAVGTLDSTDLFNCFWWGTRTHAFTATRTQRGMYASFAEGCQPAGSPTLSAPSPPSLGAGFSVTVSGVPANLAFLATGASNTTFGISALPYHLGPLGMPACHLQVSADMVQMLTGGPSVQAQWTFPNTPGLLGATFYQQAFVLHPGSNVLGARMTNAMVGVLGP